MAITLEPYTLTDVKCGSVIYEFSTAPFDAIGAGHASVSSNTVTFSNINGVGIYPLGKLTVTANVRYSATTETIFTETFEIDVVDCLAESFTMTGVAPLQDSEV